MGREIPEANSTNLRAELGAVVENKQKQKDQKKKNLFKLCQRSTRGKKRLLKQINCICFWRELP